MNKSELIDAVAEGAGLSKADATSATEALLDSIVKALGSGDQVALFDRQVGDRHHRQVELCALPALPVIL